MTQKNIVWFRNDLRLADNPALTAASEAGKIIPIYIIDTQHPYPAGEASNAWLKEALAALNQQLKNHLLVLQGDPQKIIPQLMQDEDCEHIYWNRCYTPYDIERDTALKQSIKGNDHEAHSFQACLLWEPWTIKNQQGSHYKVFTPYYKKGCLQAAPPRMPLATPKLSYAKLNQKYQNAEIYIATAKYQWIEPMLACWQISEDGAQQRFKDFIAEGLAYYHKGRDFPAKQWVSRLSPYLHFGQISPNQLFYGVENLGIAEKETEHFIRELAWREFSYYLLYYYPDLAEKNLKTNFDNFPWINDKKQLKAWQRGMTGYPLIDAGMRELWQTGYMHNRVRMVVASFLIKNLMIDWRLGEAWFWDCLVDADWASNSASWQWVAGSGADAAPFFRIFNPVTQSEKFDPEGEYIRQYVPELKSLDNKYLHNPSSTPPLVLKEAGITLGKDYPKAIVDLKSTRQRALDAYQQIK